ncbi:hypothetical protein COEREDRAFT_78156, partial [Coemansia reversa NRRL 1564]
MGPVSSRTKGNLVSESEESSTSASIANETESESNSSQAEGNNSSTSDASDDDQLVSTTSIEESRHSTNNFVNGSRRTAGRNRRSVVEDSESESVGKVATPPAEPATDASDEEFSHSGSESDEDREADVLVIRPRRVSARYNDHSPLHPRWRLRRLRQGQQGDDADSPTPRSTRQRRQQLQNGDDSSQLGYASSPTALASRRQRQRAHTENIHTTPQRRILRQQHAGEDGDNSSTTDVQTLGISSRQHSATQTSPIARKRNIVPALLASAPAENNETESAQQEMVVVSPPVIDKPREERSYKEFFPDLNVHMPLVVQVVQSPSSQSEETAADAQLDTVIKDSVDTLVPVAPATPISSVSSQGSNAQRVRFPAQTGFKRPRSHYIRNVELTEKDLAKRVEYDLDDMDREWLQKLNQTRSNNGQMEVSAEALERIIDYMEKEWFDLVKEAQRAITQQQQESLPADESACAVCGSEECDNTNAIVFCDGCNLAVHQDCYGVPYIPEGQWLCRKCMLSPAKEVSCVLCPQLGGAFKKTTTNKWAHVLCALWIPEVGISNAVYMEPIDSVDQIPRSRWKLYCHLCHRKVGACIQCSQRQCFTAFHPTCARRARLSMTVRADRRSAEPVFRAFCERHTPPTHPLRVDLDGPLNAGGAGKSQRHGDFRRLCDRRIINAMLKSTEAQILMQQAQGGDNENETGDAGACQDASLQLTRRIFDPARPVLNEYVFAQVVSRTTIARLGAQQRGKLIAQVARYWALKRSERHGAPLLKRLHLEPWTASVTQHRAQELAESQRQSVVLRIRTDLERVRLLVESVRRREREKLRRARLQVEYLRRILDPLALVLLPVVDELLE